MGLPEGTKIAYLQLHRICDQDCIFCAQPTNGKYLNFGEIQEQIDSFLKEGYTGIIFSGGEPSLSPYFFEAISYCTKMKLEMMILTNGHMFQDLNFTQRAIRAGLKKYHVSLHSHIEKIHDSLVKKQGSYRRSLSAMKNIIFAGGKLHVNITINSYNVSYFPKTISFFLNFFPEIQGFILNNLETSQITSQYHGVIADLQEIKKIIIPTIERILAAKKFLRVERIPMCYLRGYEYLSVDVEYSVMGDAKFLHFLEDKRKSGVLNHSTHSANYTYGDACQKCDLQVFCSGILGIGKFYKQEDLTSQHVEEEEIQSIILKSKKYLSQGK